MWPNKPLLVTGGSGYLGRHLTAAAAELFAVHTTYNTRPGRVRAGTSHRLDLTDREAVRSLIGQVSPAVIIHTAASNPGDDQTLMMAVNRDGSRYVTEAAAAAGARLIHLSTDVLHDGKNAPYDDDAPPTPTAPYSESKAASEKAVAEIDPGAAIVRSSLIYGLHEMDRGTASFVKRLRSGATVVMFRDQIRQPVWIATLVEALLKLTTECTDFAGIVNVAGCQPLSREAFGLQMLDWWQIDYGDRVQSALAANAPDPVPLDLRLSIAKGQSLLKMSFPGVDEVLSKQGGLGGQRR